MRLAGRPSGWDWDVGVMRLSFWFLGHCESVFILLRGMAARLGRHADVTADDLSDCLNYNHIPLPFQAINAPIPCSLPA